MCMGAKPPYPMERTIGTGSSTVLPIHLYGERIPPYQTKALNRDMGIQIEIAHSANVRETGLDV